MTAYLMLSGEVVDRLTQGFNCPSGELAFIAYVEDVATDYRLNGFAVSVRFHYN